MDGRWRVLPDSEKNDTWIAVGPGKTLGVPVVPCDDAAIERAARAIYERAYQPDARESWSKYAERQPSLAVRFRETAQAALMAAGEIDDDRDGWWDGEFDDPDDRDD